METILNVLLLTAFAAVVTAAFAYVGLVAFWTFTNLGKQAVRNRQQRRMLRYEHDPYTETLRNIERLERELREDKK